MASSFNKVLLIGNLTRDPEVRQLPSGQSVCRLGIATNRSFKNKQTGIVTQEVCFVDVDVWGTQAESCRQFLQKGKQVLIEGRLKYDQWQDTQGQNRSKHSIVAENIQFLGGSSVKSEEGAFSMDETFNVNGDKASDKSIDETQFRGAKKSEGRTPKKDKVTSSFNAGEVDFTDTPPFGNDLPF